MGKQQKNQKDHAHLLEQLEAPVDRESGKAAYEALKPRFLALDPSLLVPPSMKLSEAAGVALVALPKLVPFVGELEAKTGIGAKELLAVHGAAVASAWIAREWQAAHGTNAAVRSPGEEAARKLIEDAITLRELLFKQYGTFNGWGLIPKDDAGLVKERRRDRVGESLAAVAGVLERNEKKLKTKACIPWSEVERAKNISVDLGRALRLEREEGKAKRVRRQALEDRCRVATILVEDWTELQGAVGFLRWREGDAAELVPSLFPARPRRRKAEPAVNVGGEEPGTGDAVTEAKVAAPAKAVEAPKVASETSTEADLVA